MCVTGPPSPAIALRSPLCVTDPPPAAPLTPLPAPLRQPLGPGANTMQALEPHFGLDPRRERPA